MSSSVLISGSQRGNDASFPRLHPITQDLISHHDQDDWSVTDDGLICAPIGFYRIMERFGDAENSDLCTLVFGFKPQDLDLVPHPDDPSRKMLRSPAYILPPVDTHFVKGWAEIEMRKHQGDWLNFVLGFGNLYRMARGANEYFSNNFASYCILPNYNSSGKIEDYRISLRIDPNNPSYGFGLNQDKKSGLRDVLANRGLILKNNVKKRGDAIRFIHANFRERYSSFLKNEEVQRWEDPHPFQNMLMWFHNIYAEIKRRPKTTGTILSKSLEIALTKLTPAGLVIEAGMELLEKNAEEEKNGNAIADISVVNEESLAPLHSMKESVRKDWVALPVREARNAMLHHLRVCHDIESHRRARAVDILHNLDPVIVMSGDGPITIRAHNGMEVHYLGQERHVTYSPHRAIDELPSLYQPLFDTDGTSIARILQGTNGDPLAPDQKVLHILPHGRGRKLIVNFQPIRVLREMVNQYPHIRDSVDQHRAPSFTDAPPSAEPQMTPRQTFTHYAQVLLHPFNTKKNPKDWYLAAVCLGFGVATSLSETGHFLEAASPWAYALSAGLLTRRVSSNALTKGARRYLSSAAQACFAVGPALFAVGLTGETAPEIVSTVVKHEGGKGEMAEHIGGIAVASIIAVQRAKRLLTSLHRQKASMVP